MITEDKDYFIKNSSGKKIVSLDIGTQTIGIAISDKTHSFVFPRETIKRQGNKVDIERLRQFLLNEKTKHIVAGIPLNSQEEETKMSAFVREFLLFVDKNIEAVLITFQNENYSSIEARELMIESPTRIKNKKSNIDFISAGIILRRFLSLD